MEHLDEIDIKLLELLQAMPTHVKELSVHLNLSFHPSTDASVGWKDGGYRHISRFWTGKSGFWSVAYCHVSLKEHARPCLKIWRRHVLNFAGYWNVTTSGNFDYMLQSLRKGYEIISGFYRQQTGFSGQYRQYLVAICAFYHQNLQPCRCEPFPVKFVFRVQLSFNHKSTNLLPMIRKSNRCMERKWQGRPRSPYHSNYCS